MKIDSFCLDQELLWVIDDVISGLYSIDLKTFETKCAIEFWNLFKNGKFVVEALIKWKEEFIIIPRDIDGSWIFYNKITGETECHKVIERRCQERLVAVNQDRNLLYFFPVYVYDPVLIVDLNTLECSKMIDNWSDGALSDCYETAWKGAYNGQYVFSLIMNTRILVRMDCENYEVEFLELDIPERVTGMDYAFGELWILPMNGNRLYQIDENAQIVNSVELVVGDSTDALPVFSRIIVQKRYLFLLPYYRKGIYVYDKLERKTHIIPNEITGLEGKGKGSHVWYWEYYIKDNQICFLPFRDSCIEIDMNSLSYKKKVFFYPAVWSEEEKIRKCIRGHVSQEDSVIRETYECDLEILTKYIQHESKGEDFSKNICMGKKIWDLLTTFN